METAHRRAAGILMALSAAVIAAPIAAQDRVPVRFPPGASGTVINGTIRGQGYTDHVLDVRAGQTMTASLAVTGTNGDGTAYFNILPAGQDYGGLYVGSNDDDNSATVTFPSSGTWAIRVYLMGNDRDAGRTVGYAIDVRIPPQGSGAATQLPSPGTGLVQVVNLRGDDLLNVRGGPGTRFAVVGALSNGTSVRLLGCEGAGGARWCEIEMLDDMRGRGWVNARYLSAAGAASGQRPSDGAANDPGATSTERVRFRAGASSAEPSGRLAPGASRRYVIGARAGQFLDVGLAPDGAGLSFQIFNPDGSFLLDQVPAAQDYRGQLWQSGDHVIEVINRSARARGFSVFIGIE